MNIFSKILDVNTREVDEFRKIVAKINALEPKMAKLKDSDFAKKTNEFRKKLSSSKDPEKTLNEILPEAFALTREASSRAIGLKHYDVQMVAAVALFKGRVAEQKTGEGKTLSAIPALYLRALVGRGAHLVTVNDYLARRDAGWNGPTFDLLGMKVGTIIQENKSFVYDKKYVDKSHGDERLFHLKPVERKEAYAADIIYGTNNEYGFDYLRDNMVQSLNEMSQRGHYFAIVDEVDSVLIDEARTPLIISAPDVDPTDKYYRFAGIIGELDATVDYTTDEKYKSATLTEKGVEKVEKILGVKNLYEEDFEAIHHIENALRARSLYLRDREYVVKDGQVVIVDEFTGRLMVGRRWSDGLHQAVEAKEGVVIQQESKTLATISFQNYFRMYEHLSGMTGTAATEASEFKKIYKLEVIVVPTNRPMVRKDRADVIYKTYDAKYKAIAEEVWEKHKAGQPVLIGTTSIDKNEVVAKYLDTRGVKYHLLNAKNHESEAEVIAKAGRPGAVTVATNMAGRGVDIILGGEMPQKKSKEFKSWEKMHEAVVKAGGLHVIGTERHESRRIDNQLRGRAGRQGDPGSSRFYLSLEDDLMRVFGGERIASIMNTLKIPEDQPIENRIISRAIESAQMKVEGFHFDARKRVVEYDDVANQQRDIIYKLRRRILEAENLKREVLEKLEHLIERVMFEYPDKGNPNYEELVAGIAEIVPFDDASLKNIEEQAKKIGKKEEMQKFLEKIVNDAHASREKQVGENIMRQIERFAYLSAIDRLWIDHIDHIEDLRQGIELRAYGQRDPVVEFKNEAYDLFETLIDRVDEELGTRIFRIDVGRMPNEIPLNQAQTNVDRSDNIGLAAMPEQKVKVVGQKIGRNDLCPCGSGKKYKKCGLLNTAEHQKLMGGK